MSPRTLVLVLVAALAVGSAAATETENFGLRVLPAAHAPRIDGDASDWDLSAGIFACGDVEEQRDRFAFWSHAAYDAENLYLLVRFVDETPLNNPGQVEGDYGFAGDSVQFRAIVGGRCSHWTCWRGRDGKHVMDVVYGIKFDQGALKDAQVQGAKQAFAVHGDHHGYDHEMAIPWSLVAPDGFKPAPGGTFRLTFEPNFTVGSSGRLSVKDLFASDVQIDRVFTFMNDPSWGTATFAKAGPVEPAPVRLSDRREFAVRLEGGAPVVDWSGLIRARELVGHKTIAFDMPFDGYASLNLFAADGSVARQLLTTAFYTKGRHEVRWDGLTTPSWRDPGDPVPAGTYTWQALVHPGLHLELAGWAANAGAAPWDGPSGTDNWGGDEGDPSSAAVSGDRVLLGWKFAEAGKALVACDGDGHVQWRHSRQGMAGCGEVAADGAFVYGVNAKYVFRIAAADGAYVVWPGKDTPDLWPHDLLDEQQRKTIPDEVDALAARDGALYLGIAKGDAVLVVDGATGALRKLIALPRPVALAAGAGGVLYASSDHHGIVAIDVASGKATPFAEAADVWGLCVDGDGTVYASLRGSAQQVVAFDRSGHRARAIGRDGGRPRVGPWDASGMREPRGLAVDAKGRLWVAEEVVNPRRFSVWDARTGGFVRELFGPTTYGALGGSISPKDPLVMAGLGSEWRIDPATGRARCMAVIDDAGFGTSRFEVGANGREYLFAATGWAYDRCPLKVFERLADGAWKLRTVISYRDPDGKPLPNDQEGNDRCTTTLWADRDDDGVEDADETVSTIPGVVRFSGWHLPVAPDLSLYAGDRQYRLVGFTACGAPTWDLAKGTKMPAPGLGSADGKLVLSGGDYGVAHGQMRCFDLATGKQRWWYPDTFVGVHGSHNAPPPEVGLIRGSFSMGNVNACSVVGLPQPMGSTWVIATNVGEWHLMTERGFYLGRLFQPDPMKVSFPEKAVPGASLDEAPCGMGGEDFGGSATLAADGTLHVQAGKTAFWNVIVRGLDRVRLIEGGAVQIAEADLALAQGFKEKALQAVVGVQRLRVAKATPTFTGDIEKDFPGVKPTQFEKSSGTRVRAALAYDDRALHVAWEVQDRTPWANGARSPDAMYWGGDTVDLQLATDPAAPADRGEAARGDVRISIGRCGGKDVAVAFRKVADAKHPKTFSSGVVKEYAMDSVTVLDDAVIAVVARGEGYVVEASIPLADLGIAPREGLRLRGDLGATFGDQAGQRTRLRSFWSNQHTGIVDDVVYELMLEPRFWGEFAFE